MHFISQDQMGRESQSKKKVEEGNLTNRFKRGVSKLRGRQMDNKYCFFSSTSISRLLWTQLISPYNCPFFHIVYLSCISHEVLLNQSAAFYVLTSIEQKDTNVLRGLPFTDSIVLLKQKGRKVK